MRLRVNRSPILFVMTTFMAIQLLSSSAEGFTLYGTPSLLSPGQAPNDPLDLLGEQLDPRLDIDGFMRYQLLGYRLNDSNNGVMVPELDLDANLQLTATQRIHALFRPIEGGNREPTLWVFASDNQGWTERDMAAPAELFYEGQPLNWISPHDRAPLDITVSGGRVPLFLQNGLWFDNIFDGAIISKDNIQLGNLSNLNLFGFLTRGETQGGIDFLDRAQQRKKLMGVGGDADWYAYFFEFGWATSYDNHHVRVLNSHYDLDRSFWAISATRTFGVSGGVSLRALGSTGNGTRGGGELLALEIQKRFLGVLGYANFFGATRDWLPASNQGSPLSREGILFTFDRLAPFPQLNPNPADTIGSAMGVILNPKGIVTYTPEVGWVFDHSSQANHQVGAAMQIQADLASLLIPVRTLADVARRGLLYGVFARLTFVGLRNDNTQVARDRFEFGSRLELIYKF
jgi:hypothetical protein